MNIFKSNLTGTYFVIVKSATVGSYSLLGALTQQEAVMIALSQIKDGKDIEGIVRRLDVTITLDEPHSDDDQMYLVAEENGRVKDYVAWDDDKQTDILQLMFSWVANPAVHVHVVPAKELRGRI